jgi:hypothetical protein
MVFNDGENGWYKKSEFVVVESGSDRHLLVLLDVFLVPFDPTTGNFNVFEVVFP